MDTEKTSELRTFPVAIFILGFQVFSVSVFTPMFGPKNFPLDCVYPGAILACMKTTLQRWGNSQGVRLPKSLVESLGIAIGSSVIVEISGDGSQIMITPTAVSRPIRGRHRIEDLIAASSPKAFGGEDNWGKVVGKEVW